MRGTDGCRWYAIPLRVIPERGQVSENVASSPSKQTWDVLQDCVAGSKVANDRGERGPEPPFVGLRETSSGDRDGLTGKPAGHNVHSGSGLGLPPFDSGADIVVPFDVRPVLREDLATERVDLDLADDGHPGPFEAEFETADTREQ